MPHPLVLVRRLVVHHSASPRETTAEQIKGWHVKDRGFDDIGYHWIVEADGAVKVGRRLTYQGAHARGANGDSWGVCVTGDNTREDRRWSEAQIVSLRQFLHAVQLLVPGIVVCGHRDAVGGKTATECPGLDVRALLGV